MTSDKVKVFTKAFGFFIPYLGRTALQRVAAVGHRWSWQNTPDAKNVVVLGGSFAGIELVKRLSETLPTGYKAVWIEKNSHLNFSFNFPRYSVLEGHEHAAFIPYDGIAKNAPAGIFTRIQDKAIGVTENNQIQLASGDNIDFEYLAIATGSSQPLPVQVTSTERNKGCHELQGVQKTIKASQKIAIIGGGAVGVEIASDIKDFYPDKEVTLVHSRGQLLNNFGKRFGDYTLNALRDELQIRVLLNERPAIPGNFARGAALKFSDGHEEQFDLVVSSNRRGREASALFPITS
jgi:NADH dehydrogenase FAD-containing subunit